MSAARGVCVAGIAWGLALAGCDAAAPDEVVDSESVLVDESPADTDVAPPETFDFHGLACEADVPWVADAPCGDADCGVAFLGIVCGFLAPPHPFLLAERTDAGWVSMPIEAYDPETASRLLDALRTLTGVADAAFPMLAVPTECVAPGGDGPTSVTFDEGFRFVVGTAVDHFACARAGTPDTWDGGYATLRIDPTCADRLQGDARWSVAEDGESLRFDGFAAHVAWAGTRAEVEALTGPLVVPEG